MGILAAFMSTYGKLTAFLRYCQSCTLFQFIEILFQVIEQ